MARLRGRAKAALSALQEQIDGEERLLEALRQEAAEAEGKFNLQQTVVTALRGAYSKFEKSLAAPRQPAKPAATKRGGGKRAQKSQGNGRCTARLESSQAVCGMVQSHGIHDPALTYADSHPFQPTATAQPATASSSPSNGEQSSTASTETSREGAPDVARALSGRE